jgi:hypothetical protein
MKKLIMLMLLVCSNAFASVTDLKLSTAQIFDVQWYISGGRLNASGFNYIYASVNYATQTASAARWTAAQTADAGSNGRYISFFHSTTHPGTYGMAVYNSDGSMYKIINNTGSFRALADGAIFYNGNGMWGTLITTGQGYSNGQSGSWTVTQDYPNNTQLQAYTPPSSTPLSAGQTAEPAEPPAPTYVSNITPAQQSQYNAAISRRNSIIKNSIYVDQIGSLNTVDAQQTGSRNMLAGVGADAAPIHGDYNNVTTKQGNVGNTLGKNLIEMNVYGSYNVLQLNQGQSITDYGGHMQTVNISGNNNSVTTNQVNTGNYGHYISTSITGNSNTKNISQSGNAIKQTFVTTSGNSNTLSALQDGLGDHYLSVSMTGNSNDAQVTQTGNTKNAATLNLTNAGAPASVTLSQSGGQTYNVDRSCTSTCGRVTVSQ